MSKQRQLEKWLSLPNVMIAPFSKFERTSIVVCDKTISISIVWGLPLLGGVVTGLNKRRSCIQSFKSFKTAPTLSGNNVIFMGATFDVSNDLLGVLSSFLTNSAIIHDGYSRYTALFDGDGKLPYCISRKSVISE